MEYSKLIDAAANKYAEDRHIPFGAAFDALMSLIFNSNCDVMRVLEWNVYPQEDIDFVW